MNHAAAQGRSAWLASAVAWLTPRRLRAQAIVLAVCLWGTCAVDFATPGVFDRAGNVKFQDFLPFYVSGRLIAEGRAGELYDQQVVEREIREIVQQRGPFVSAALRLPYLYGPQVALLFVPFSRFSFSAAAWIWTTACLFGFFGCIFLAWRVSPSLRLHARAVAICAMAFPPLFHFFVRGQISVLVLACFTAAFLVLRRDGEWLGGIALGLLAFKPQFLAAIPLVLLLARAWKLFAAASVSAAAQVVLARLCFGSAVMRTYFETLWHTSRWIGSAELGVAQIQMHSLRSFWLLLIPWPELALVLYLLSSIVMVGMAAAIWKSESPLALRFCALTLAAVLVNPHLFVYDLLVLAPMLLLLVDWAVSNAQHHQSAAVRLLAYLVFILPLLGPLSRWTHVQLSVPTFVVLLWVLWRSSASGRLRIDT
jgi:hypothetical protein